MMGLKHLSKHAHFEDKFELDSEPSISAGEMEEGDDVESRHEDEEIQFPRTGSLFRDLHEPLVWLPPHLSASSTLAMEEPATFADVNEDLMLRELDDEQDLDEQDSMAEKQYEKDLWHSVGMTVASDRRRRC